VAKKTAYHLCCNCQRGSRAGPAEARGHHIQSKRTACLPRLDWLALLASLSIRPPYPSPSRITTNALRSRPASSGTLSSPSPSPSVAQDGLRRLRRRVVLAPRRLRRCQLARAKPPPRGAPVRPRPAVVPGPPRGLRPRREPPGRRRPWRVACVRGPGPGHHHPRYARTRELDRFPSSPNRMSC
jgi:hypothetical protein